MKKKFHNNYYKPMTLTTLKDFAFNDHKINIYGTNEKPLFMAKEIGDLLGIKNIRQNLANIPNDWKVVCKTYTLGGEQNATFITEQSVYKLVFRSNKTFADEFTNKVCEILKELRTTGQYKLTRPATIKNRLTFEIKNERDLHHRVVNFIKNYYPTSLFTANLGELQDTSTKRIESACKGYLAGSTDLEIKECSKGYIGLCIEFKSPSGQGTIKENQLNVHDELKERGYQVIVSNDYEYLLLQVKEYLDNKRYKCKYCLKRFKLFYSIKSREVHYKSFHKIR